MSVGRQLLFPLWPGKHCHHGGCIAFQLVCEFHSAQNHCPNVLSKSGSSRAPLRSAGWSSLWNSRWGVANACLRLCIHKRPISLLVSTASSSKHSQEFDRVTFIDKQMAEDSSSTPAASDESELERLQRECASMATTLKQLEQQELGLQCQNAILAREAMLCGFDPKLVEPPPPKRRRAPAKKKATQSSTQS